MTKYLTLWLEGPLQSWGVDSHFGARHTLDFPSRSGLTGMLLSASGDSGPQEELLKELSECPLVVFTFNDSTPVLTDFHMIGNGYDSNDPWQRRMTPKKATGEIPVGGGSRMTYRDYLQGRHFAAIWEMTDHLAEKFSDALQKPVFEIYLGKKCCLPSANVFLGLFAGNDNAVESIKNKIAQLNLNLQPNRRISETAHDCPNSQKITLADVPLRFGLHKVYRERAVTIQTIDSFD